MKRKLTLLLTFIFIFTLALPIRGFAAELDKELENAIKIAKTKFQIPESYEFSSNIRTRNEKKYFNLNWRNKDELDSTSISVTVDGSGVIVEYNKYTPYDYKQTRRLPGMSKQDARIKAEQHIEHIAPGLLKELGYQETSQSGIVDTSYYFNYYRLVNDVPFYNDRVYLNVNRDTGELQNYSRQWTDTLSFPDAEDTISNEKAEEAYISNLGLRLIYKTSTADDALRAYPVYVPVYNNGAFGIDAFTGEMKRFGNSYYPATTEYSKNQVKQAAGVRDEADIGVQLSPEELEAVQEAGKLVTLEAAEKIARDAEFLGISDDYVREYYYLGTEWPEREKYIYTLQFNKPADDTQAYNEYISVTIDAKSGVIKSFYRSAPYKEDGKPKYDINEAKAIVEKFITDNYDEYYKGIEYDSISSESNIDITVKNNSYSFIYSRMVNGAAYPDNGIRVYYDNINGNITNFDLNWYDITFPSVADAIGKEAAAEKLFDKVGLGLEYNLEYSRNPIIRYETSAETNSKAVLLYVLKPGMPLVLDAATGELLNYDGTIYKEPVDVNYTDIEGHFAQKQITVLAENGIYLDGSEFKPDEAVLQKDFLYLLSKTMYYYGPVISSESTDDDIDEFYLYLIRQGIVKQEEKAPESNVTREKALIFIIRALNFERVADLQNIFNCPFQDKDEIDASLTGYVTIAAGLGIVNSSSASFRPKDMLKRSEAAVMIYNYLQS